MPPSPNFRRLALALVIGLTCGCQRRSIFPTSIGANPMQSIYTFAKIFADSNPGDARN
jgi:hypothetical protein